MQLGKSSSRLFLLVLPLIFVPFTTNSIFAATFVVTKFTDTNDGVCDSDCSLREAIAAANATGTSDVIEFDPKVFSVPRVIALDKTELTITDSGSLSILGPGSHLLQITGQMQIRLFRINEAADVSISSITFRHGHAGSSEINDGGCFLNSGRLQLSNSEIFSCYAPNSGGAIYNAHSGELRVFNSKILSNTSSGSGGGVSNFNVLVFSNSTLRDNGSFIGGGLLSDNSVFEGQVLIENSTISHNYVPAGSSSNGGGIWSSGTATLSNSTVCNNSATGSGAGVFNIGAIRVVSSTICSNRAGNGPGSAGGGIMNAGNDIVRIHNTILADNLVRINEPSDLSGTITSDGFNLIEDVRDAQIIGVVAGNLLGLKAELLPLSDNGGPTYTAGLMPNSPAIDAGPPFGIPNSDQRGVTRDKDGNLDGLSRPDIGAYERELEVITVTKIDDTNDGNCDSDCSLREALDFAHQSLGVDIAIVFDPLIFSLPQQIDLNGQQLVLSRTHGTVFIAGPGPELLTISGDSRSRVITNARNSTASINGIRITNGSASGGGGGIANLGRLS